MGQDDSGHHTTTAVRTVSFRHHADLAAAHAEGSWRTDASTADIVIMDARGAQDEGLSAAEATSVNGSPLLVLVDDVQALPHFYDAGATHFLIAPRSAGEIVQAVRFALRVRNPGGGQRRGEPMDAIGSAAVREWLTKRIEAERCCSLVSIALSRLDIVNAAHGRPAVDILIEAVRTRIAAAARASVGEEMIVARVDGTTLVLATAACDDRIAATAAAIGAALARPFDIGGVTVVLGSRFAIVEQESDDDAAGLLRRAADALADAKASDGAVFRIADPQGVAPLDRLAVDLHHAIRGGGGEIDVVFQPQVEIASGRIVGVEALARWDHPVFGPLGAATLFDAAERADLGIALSDHIQQLTLARAAAWPRSLGAIRLSINLTAADVTRVGFAPVFLDRIDASGFPRGRLTVEVTETGMIQELEAAAGLLAELRAGGCRIAIDDFGTGYSSLAYLKALPLDYLKIDQALARDIDGSPRDRVVVRGVIDIARALGLAVIAEGVETPAQLALLAAEGCGYYQGFLRSAPLAEADLIAMVESER